MNILNRPAIKFEARNFISIDKRWLSIFWAGIVPFLLGAGKSYYRISLTKNNSFFDLDPSIASFSLSLFLITCLVIPFKVAFNGYKLNALRNNTFNSKFVYDTASSNYVKFLITGIVRDVIVYLWSLLLVVPGIIKGLSYSMTDYVIFENPNLDPREAMDISKRITYGFRTDILIMYLSFIPWYFFASITAGIGSIYVLPYVETTEAMFYENLKKHAIERNIVSPNEFGIYWVLW